MASGDNVDVIEVMDSSFRDSARGTELSSRLDDSGDEDDKSIGDKTTVFDSSASHHAGVGSKTPSGVSRNKSERERKIGHRRVGVGGEITYKKIQTTQIMGSIQLGIQHAVGGLASKPERDLLMQDFMTVETTNFPSEGSNHTPAHHFSEFKFKNYAPIAFRYFRDLFGIQPDDFLMSMCSAPLRELSNPGASGSIFYLTEDDEFIIKTVQHKEGEFLQTLLPGYYMNLNQNPRTLLPKFFGLYCYRCNSKNVRLVAMNNLLPSAVKLHQKYDLKGSTYKRKASKSERSKKSPTYKDLDFMEHHPEGIFLEADTYGALVKTIQRDCRVLESFKIMDYSLLVGIHNLDQAAREKTEQKLSPTEEESGEAGCESGNFGRAERERDREDRIGAVALNRTRSINRQRLVAHSTAMESIQAESEPIDEEDDVPPGGIPARNARGERLLLFIGIIDILQSYRLKKKLEHTWKSMIHDGDTVSVHRPGFYAQRFQDFMAKTVFKKIPSLDLPEIKGNHRKFRNLVTSYIALKHSPSKRKSITRPLRPLEGDFDSTVVAATGSTAMHATSPTKPVSPTLVKGTPIVSGGPTVASNTVPIATSTPINLPTSTADGVVSVAPPPLTASSTVRASYPAVLKGRSAASPPNPNLVPSGKVPPPVPPRGAGKKSEDHRGGNISSSSSTSGRGDCRNASSLHDKIMVKIQEDCLTSPRSSLHVPNLYQHSDSRLHATGFFIYSEKKYYPPVYYDEYNNEDEEFIEVEKSANSYVIRTSPHPFKPTRRKVRPTPSPILQSSHSEDVPSFILPPGGINQQKMMNINTQMVNVSYKMSRKDNKYSATYAERVRDKKIDVKKIKESLKIPSTSETSSIIQTSSLNSSREFPYQLKDHSNPIRVKTKSYKMQKHNKQIAPRASFKKPLFSSISKTTRNSRKVSTIRRSFRQNAQNIDNRKDESTLKYNNVMSSSVFTMKVSSPNIQLDAKKISETLKPHVSDDKYHVYLKKQSNCESSAGTSRNNSFLHGYHRN